MQGLCIAEVANVVEPAATRFVRNVQTNAPIQAEHEEADVVANAYPRAESQFLEEVGKVELRPRTAAVAVQRPHVAGVEEECPVQASHQMRPILHVCLHLNFARLLHIRPSERCRTVSAGTYLAHVESPDAVCSAHKELF